MRPTRIRENTMKKVFVLLVAMLMSGSVCFAQKDADKKLFEEAGSRDKEPEFKVFVTPQICDVKFLNTEREEFGPYYFNIDGTLDEAELLNAKNRAVHRAMKESDADVIVAMVPHSYVSAENEKVLVVEITGYPAKYVNFRPLGTSDVDFETIRTVYPSPFTVAGGTVINQTGESTLTNTKKSK